MKWTAVVAVVVMTTAVFSVVATVPDRCNQPIVIDGRKVHNCTCDDTLHLSCPEIGDWTDNYQWLVTEEGGSTLHVNERVLEFPVAAANTTNTTVQCRGPTSYDPRFILSPGNCSTMTPAPSTTAMSVSISTTDNPPTSGMSTATVNPHESGKEDAITAAVVIVVLGGVVLMAIAVVLCLYFWKKKSTGNGKQPIISSPSPSPPTPTPSKLESKVKTVCQETTPLPRSIPGSKIHRSCGDDKTGESSTLMIGPINFSNQLDETSTARNTNSVTGKENSPSLRPRPNQLNLPPQVGAGTLPLQTVADAGQADAISVLHHDSTTTKLQNSAGSPVEASATWDEGKARCVHRPKSSCGSPISVSLDAGVFVSNNLSENPEDMSSSRLAARNDQLA